ncbi:hypothetical protein, partial [Psychroserpens burtonensis]|uniref:hypothetical protein n=1 Tax=Psychroserpens burtonensis TaxID=49278 RepID=UPI001C9A7ABB
FVTRSIVYNVSFKTNINIEPKIDGASPIYFKYSCCTYNLNLENIKTVFSKIHNPEVTGLYPVLDKI